MVLLYTELSVCTAWSKPLLDRWPRLWLVVAGLAAAHVCSRQDSGVVRALSAGQQYMRGGAAAWHRVTGARGWRQSFR